MSDKYLKNKVAVITGSTSGIGLAVARKLAGHGAHIMFNGFGDVAEIEKIRKAVEKEYGVKTSYSDADLSKPDAVRGLIKHAVKDLGSVDILVNNAGIQHTAPIESFPEEKWKLILDLMLSAPFYAIQEALPVMRKNKWGRIINISSVHGLVASKEKAAYVSAKHGLIGLTRVTALETAQDAITCNAICPGWVLTPLVQKQIDDLAARENLSPADAKFKLLSAKQPSGEFVEPEQIGDFISYLCTESAAQMRGGAYTIDGAWTVE